MTPKGSIDPLIVRCSLSLTPTTPVFGCQVSAKLNLGKQGLISQGLCNDCITPVLSHIFFSESVNQNAKLYVTYKRIVWWRDRNKLERERIVSVVSSCSKNIGLFFPSLSEPPCPAQVMPVHFGELMSLPEPHYLYSCGPRLSSSQQNLPL